QPTFLQEMQLCQILQFIRNRDAAFLPIVTDFVRARSGALFLSPNPLIFCAALMLSARFRRSRPSHDAKNDAGGLLPSGVNAPV
ncbi:MAG: hypothetical protein IJK52_03360, partial [Oscillospiraceae bacterium]|nr:hypothetical protein [Oscillospiraceae bacterium]